jgi:hypothetical protein
MGLEVGGGGARLERSRASEMRKVVFLIDQPLDERNYERFGIRTWLERNWEVEVWDLTPWAQATVWRSFVEFGSKIRDFAGYFAIASRRQLARRLLRAGLIEYFVDLSGQTFQTIRAKLALERAGAVRIVCAGGSMPTPDRTPLGLMAKLAKVAARGPKGATKWLCDSFFQRLVAPHITTGMAIVSGEQSIADVKNCAEIIRTHNFDYDIYLALSKSTKLAAERYALFIDQDYCFHPEYLYQSIRSVASPEKYFPAVCNGLKVISQALALDVRIAAHPRATYQQRGRDYFEGFRTELGRTAELIRDCAVVICHDSTAIQFAVLFGKPAIFVTTNEINRAYEGSSIHQVATELGKSPINLDGGGLQSIEWHREMEIDADKYARYRSKYIKTIGSPDIPLWHIVIDQIESVRN